jgi:predicted metallopeptidase
MDGQGFDFTANMRRLVQDMVDRLEELRHIHVDRVAFSFAQARKRTRHGIYATLTPMRFQGGKLHTKRRGDAYTLQRLYDAAGREMLYILTFYLPRFMDVELNEKLITILHELWHISPEFDGDLRRHPGRCYVHSPSQADYDAQMQVLANRWLQQNPPSELYEFLGFSFAELHRRHGRVFGARLPHPKLIRVSDLPTGATEARV